MKQESRTLGRCHQGDSPSGGVNVRETTGFSIYCSDSTRPMSAIDGLSSVGRGRHRSPGCGSSGVTIVILGHPGGSFSRAD